MFSPLGDTQVLTKTNMKTKTIKVKYVHVHVAQKIYMWNWHYSNLTSVVYARHKLKWYYDQKNKSFFSLDFKTMLINLTKH